MKKSKKKKSSPSKTKFLFNNVMNIIAKKNRCTQAMRDYGAKHGKPNKIGRSTA